MDEETPADELNETAPGAETAAAEGASATAEAEEVLEGEIISGTWVNPQAAGYVPPQSAASRSAAYTIPEGKPSFVRMIFGGVVMVTEEIAERTVPDDQGTSEQRQQMIQAAVNQAVSQAQSLDRRPFADLRYGAIGLASGMLDGAHSGGGRVSALADSTARAAGKVIGPIWNSFLFAPLHKPALRVEQAGEEKVNQWIQRGRVEEVRSRALAEVSLNNFVEESVSDLTQNTQVQMLVQEVIANQSTSLITEILEEARERVVSLDMLLMGKLRQDIVAAPEFRAAYLQSLSARRSSYGRVDLANSMAGTYAGPLTRLLAFLVDVVILIFVVGLTSAFVSSTLNLFGLTESANDFLQSGGMIATLMLLFVAAFNFLWVSGYFLFSWVWTGATVGELVFGIRVVNKEGGRVSFARALLRLLGAYVSAAVFFIGFLWALFDGRRQGWHDKFGATFVLYDWPARPEETFLNQQVMRELAEER